jgi:hypothetical protein
MAERVGHQMVAWFNRDSGDIADHVMSGEPGSKLARQVLEPVRVCSLYAFASVACVRLETEDGVGKNSSRKKQDRPKAATRRAEQERRRTKAACQRQSAERHEQLRNPSASPADIAEILAAELPERVAAADMMHLRMSLGVPAEEVVETARLLLERTAPEPPGIGALAVAALAAHLARGRGCRARLCARTARPRGRFPRSRAAA